VVNLADLALALEAHSEDRTWRFDPVDGTVAPFFSSSVDQPGDQNAADELIAIEPLPSAVGYRDMEDFGCRAPSTAGGRFGASRTCSSWTFPSCAGRGSPSTTYAESAVRSNGSPIETSSAARPRSGSRAA
jgi:hypothetical protein